MARIKKYKELLDSDFGLDVNNVFVAFKYGEDIDEMSKIYIKKEDAEKKVKEINEYYYKYFRSVNKKMSDIEYETYFSSLTKCKVITLYDAIQLIIENTQERWT